MPSPQSAILFIQEKGRGPVVGQVPVVFSLFDEKERFVRAMKVGGLCLLGAVCAVPFPGVHVIAVPALLILSPILGIREKGMQGGLAAFEIPCPNCAKNLPVFKRQVKAPFEISKYSFEDVCNECSREWTFSGRSA